MDELDDDLELIPSVLAVDLGNTRVRIAHVKGETVSGMQGFDLDDLSGAADATVGLWKSMPLPRKIVAASVNPPALVRLEQALSERLDEPVLVIGRDLPLPIETDLAQPDAVGVDRLCAAVAAYNRLGAACVVADFGSAATVDCVSDAGVFLGGAIMPGLGMSAQALHEHTEQLPQVELEDPKWVFGKDTRQAIVGGLVFGARGALRTLVEAYATELGHWPLLVLTGGDAEVVGSDMTESDLVQAIVPDLTLRGVAIAYYNSLLK